MARSRDAVSTIKGYYFQFDYYILQLLCLQNDEASVCIEGIEDVDILSPDLTKAVQCKYFDSTSCSPSVIGKAVRPMLKHFAEHKTDRAKYTYSLFGHYASGQESVELPLTVEYVKEKFLTYTEKSVRHKLHEELSLTDKELEKFIERLDVILDASTYEEQIEEVIGQLQLVLHCSEYDARFYYYNNAVAFVKDISVKKTVTARTVTRKAFLEAIEKKRDLFDRWYIEHIGFEKYYKATRKQFFARMNVSPAERFFLIECDDKISDLEVAEIIIEISNKWSKLSKRDSKPFCPYIYFHGITVDRLKSIKSMLLDNNIHIWDGYEFKDADFSPISLVRPVNYHIGVRAKIVNKAAQIEPVLSECCSMKKVYQFYLTKPFYRRNSILGSDFQIQKTEDVLKII